MAEADAVPPVDAADLLAAQPALCEAHAEAALLLDRSPTKTSRGVARVFAVAHKLRAAAIIGDSSPLSKAGWKWAEQWRIGTPRE